MEKFEGKVAVVTGAGSGMGRAMALRFGVEGASVVLADVQPDALAESAAMVRDTGAEALGVEVDVSSAESVASLAEATLERFGAVHVLCNNAGVGGGGTIADQQLVDWRWVLGVNLWGVVHGIHAFLPLLEAHGEDAHVVNTASIAGLVAGRGLGPYNASKFAVVAISETLQRELQAKGSRVGVTVLCPGNVRTNIAVSQRNRPEHLRRARPGDAAARPRLDARQSNARIAQEVEAGMDPAEVADMVVDAIRHRRFWLVTHPEYLPAIARRTEELVEGRNPPVDP